MEPAGIAVGVVGLASLFTSAVDCFEYVQLGRNFGQDFGTSQLKLDNARLRLSRWGEAVGIHADDDAEAALAPRERRQARRNIGQILSLFTDAEGISNKTFKTSGGGASDTALTVCDPASDMDGGVLALHQQMRSLALARQRRAGARQKVRWVLYEKAHFRELIEDITGLVDDLEKICPPDARRRLCQEEVETLGASADLPLLRDVAEEVDPGLVEAVGKALAEKEGQRLPSVVFSGSGNRGFQLGNNAGTISGFSFGAFKPFEDGEYSAQH